MDKKPKIRFKGFDDAWEQRKLGEVFEERNERSAYGEMISVTINSGIVKASELGRHDNSSADKSKYKKVEVGDIAYNSMRMWQGASGYSPYSGILSPAYTVCKPRENTDSLFFSYAFKKPEMIHKFEINSQGLTKDTWNLKFPPFSEIETNVPNYDEQVSIGQLLSKLDNLITLHQRKYEKLKNVKKSMLEKMFPKNNSKFPEIRFKGFTDAWEQRELNYYLETSTEKNTKELYNKTDVFSVSGDFGIVNQIEFQGRSFAGASVANYGIVNTGDVVYTKSPLNSNPYGIIKTNKLKPGIVSTLYAVYHPKKNTFSNFVQTYFEQNARVNNYLHPLVNKGAKNDMKVSNDNALKGDVVFPNYEEQKRIYDFFEALDNLITLHQRKCEKLKNIKKSMLEKMFV